MRTLSEQTRDAKETTVGLAELYEEEGTYKLTAASRALIGTVEGNSARISDLEERVAWIEGQMVVLEGMMAVGLTELRRLTRTLAAQIPEPPLGP
jgi:hypothetical protein